MVVWRRGVLACAIAASVIAMSVRSTGAQEPAYKLPINDVTALIGLAHKLAPDAVLTDLKGCFTIPGCGRGMYDSVLSKYPSTRLIAALRDCRKLESVRNEFQQRDLDTETRAAVVSAAATAPTRFTGLQTTAAVGKFDFNRQGFPLQWNLHVRVFSGPKTCTGQSISDPFGAFPADFYVGLNKSLLPSFVAVPMDKARAWVDAGGPTAVASFEVNATKVWRGMLGVPGKPFDKQPTGWVFEGDTTLTSVEWRDRNGQILDRITINPVAPEAKAALAPAGNSAPVKTTVPTPVASAKSEAPVPADPNEAVIAALELPPSGASELKAWKELYDRTAGRKAKNWTGMTVKPFTMTAQNSQGFGTIWNKPGIHGHEVVAVAGGSPASRAGLKSGDVIMSFTPCSCTEIQDGRRQRIDKKSMDYFYAALLHSHRNGNAKLSVEFIRRDNGMLNSAVLKN